MLPTIERAPRRSRYSSATLYSSDDADPGRPRRRRELCPVAVLRDDGVPVASSIATRVSPRSTLTNTCFFNFGHSFEKFFEQPLGWRALGFYESSVRPFAAIAARPCT